MGLEVQRVIPILRIFDEPRAREFYLDYLGCNVDWEHRFEGSGPLYMQVSRGKLVLHLSEHHGDGSPGHIVYVTATGVRELHAELQARPSPSPTPASPRGPGESGGGACFPLLPPCAKAPGADGGARGPG